MVMKRKYPFIPHRYPVNLSSTSRNHRSNHDRHINTLENVLEPVPVFPQNCFDKKKLQNRRDIYVDEMSIVPKRSRSILLRKSNVYLCNSNQGFHFINVDLSQLLNRYLARKSNQFAISYCDQSIDTWKIHHTTPTLA